MTSSILGAHHWRPRLAPSAHARVVSPDDGVDQFIRGPAVLGYGLLQSGLAREAGFFQYAGAGLVVIEDAGVDATDIECLPGVIDDRRDSLGDDAASPIV